MPREIRSSYADRFLDVILNRSPKVLLLLGSCTLAISGCMGADTQKHDPEVTTRLSGIRAFDVCTVREIPDAHDDISLERARDEAELWFDGYLEIRNEAVAIQQATKDGIPERYGICEQRLPGKPSNRRIVYALGVDKQSDPVASPGYDADTPITILTPEEFLATQAPR